MSSAVDVTPVDSSTGREVVGAVIAYTLLLLYVGTTGYMLAHVISCGRHGGCPADIFDPSLLYIVTTVGGLVSALVVARLAAADPDREVFSLAAMSTESPNSVSVVLAWVYLGCWFVIGLLALIVGSLVFPNANQTVSDIGRSWLGIAVAAAYAYFGIRPTSK